MSRRGLLTRTQFAMWLDDAARRDAGTPAAVVYATWDLPAHVPTQRIRDAVHALCLRYEALRTGYELDGRGQLWQVVRPAQPPDIVCREADSDRAVAGSVQRLVEDFQAAGFRLDGDPSIRIGVVTRAHRPRKIILMVHHIACDAWGMRILQTELDAWLRSATGRPPADLPAPGVQPLDHARDEDSPSGRRQADRALSYLREQFHLIPPRLFPEPPADSRSAGVRTRLVVSLDESTLTTLGRRCGTTPSVVIAAVYNAVLSIHTGHARCPIVLSSSNRHTAKLRDSIGAFFGSVPMCCDLSGDPPFSVVTGRVRDAYLRALRHSSYPVDTMKEIRAGESFRRGAAIRAGTNFNLRTDERYRADMLATAARPGEVVLEQATPAPGIDIALDAAVDATRCLLTLTAAGHIVTPVQARQLLLAMQTLLTTAACGAADPRISDVRQMASMAGPDRRAGWIELDNTWVDLAQTEAVLNEHPAVERAVVFGPADWPSESESGAELVGCVATRQPDLTPYALRRYLVASSETGAAIMAPHRYVIRRDVPDRPREPSAWRAPGQLAHGRGLAVPARPALSPQETALCRAVARTHGVPKVSPEGCYLLLGGRLRQLPAVIAELERAGYHGPPYDRFTGWHTLAELALLLRTTTAAEKTGPTGS